MEDMRGIWRRGIEYLLIGIRASGVQYGLLLALAKGALGLLALMALGRRLQFWEPWLCATLEATNHPIIVRARLLLLLGLLAFRCFALIPQVWRYACVDVIELCHVVLNQPRCACPSFSSDSLLYKGSQDLLCEDLAIPADMCIVDHSLFSGSVVEANKVSGEGRAEGAIWQELTPKTGLVAHNSSEALASNHMYCHCLSRVVI